MDNWAFFDANGNEVTRGWQGEEYQARDQARALAYDRGLAIEFQRESELCVAEGDEIPKGEVVEPESREDRQIRIAEALARGEDSA